MSPAASPAGHPLGAAPSTPPTELAALARPVHLFSNSTQSNQAPRDHIDPLVLAALHFWEQHHLLTT